MSRRKILLVVLLTFCGMSSRAGSLSGRITNSGGSGLPYVFIDLYDADGTYFDYTVTDGNGNYTFSNLGVGAFYVHTDTLGEYVEEWYDDVPGASEDTFFEPIDAGATAVSVGISDSVTGIDIVLEPAGSIAGRITDAGGNPVPSVYVDVYQPDGNRFFYDLTDSSGNYEVVGLPAGDYAARTDSMGAYVDRWHDQTVAFDRVGPAAAGVTSLTVTAGRVLSSVNIQLDTGGELRGTLHNGTGEPVRGVYVDMLDVDGTSLEFDRSDTNGVFQLKGLPAGSYYLGTDGLGAYIDLWYEQTVMANRKQPAVDGATLVAVPEKTLVSGIDFTMDVGAAISGTVVSTGGQVVARGFVDVFLGTNFFDYGLIDSNGTFMVGGLPDGVYHAKVDTLGAYLDEWHDDVVVIDPGDPAGDGATDIVITNGLSVTGVVFELRLGGEIAGHITDTNGLGIAGVYADLYDGGGRRRFYARSDVDGAFRLGGLPGGIYYLNTVSDGQYADEWYDDQPAISYTNPSADTADALVVIVGETLGGVDFQLRQGGAIAGTVTATNDAAVENATVSIYYDDRIFARRTTDSNGVYRVEALPDGTYYVRVGDVGGLLGEWYARMPVSAPDDPVSDGATAVVLAGDARRTDIDFRLGSGGSIKGTVRNGENMPIGLAAVDLFDARGRYRDSAVALANGSYAFEQVAPGTYYVGSDTLGAYRDEWFDDVVRLTFVNPVADGATLVSVEEGGSVTAGFVLALPPPDPVTLRLPVVGVWPLTIEWDADADRAYQVERRINLRAGVWGDAPSGTNEFETSYKAASAAGFRSYRDPAPPTSNAAYRVRSLAR